MTKKQREYLEYCLDNLLRKCDRCEERQDKAEAEGDLEKVKRLDHKIDKILAEMDGMRTVLNCLGYTARIDLVDDVYKSIILDDRY